MTNDKPKPTVGLTLTVEFDQRLFRTFVEKFDVTVWNAFVRRLYDADLTAAVWLSGSQPPPVSIFFRFTEDVRVEFPDADFRPVWFIADDGKDQEGMPEIFVMPSEEIQILGNLSLLVDRT